MKDRSLVRASDIGLWAFCQRAWWLANVKQVEHQNPAILQRGSAMHLAHGQTVQRAQTLKRLAILLLALALILAGLLFVWLTLQSL